MFQPEKGKLLALKIPPVSIERTILDLFRRADAPHAVRQTDWPPYCTFRLTPKLTDACSIHNSARIVRITPLENEQKSVSVFAAASGVHGLRRVVLGLRALYPLRRRGICGVPDHHDASSRDSYSRYPSTPFPFVVSVTRPRNFPLGSRRQCCSRPSRPVCCLPHLPRRSRFQFGDAQSSPECVPYPHLLLFSQIFSALTEP